MTVDESWNQNHIRCIDDLACRLEICPYRCDLLSLDQHITFGQIADLWIHAEDCSALQQNSAVSVRTRDSLHNLGFLITAFCLAGVHLTRRRCDQRHARTDLEEVTPRTAVSVCTVGRERSNRGFHLSFVPVVFARESLLNRGKPPQTCGFLFTDVLADFLIELRFRLPRTILFELSHHSCAGTRNAEDVFVGGGIEIDWNETVLFEFVSGFLTDILADLFIKLCPGLPRPVLCKLNSHTAAGARYKQNFFGRSGVQIDVNEG